MNTASTRSLRRQAFSLLEVMIAMSVFAVVAAGSFSVAMMTRYMADQQVYENTAFTVAQSLIEQIKSSEFQTVRLAAQSGEAGTLRTIRAAVENTSDDNIRIDFLNLNAWNDRLILVDLVKPQRRLLVQEDGTAVMEPVTDWDGDDTRRLPVYMRMRIFPAIAELTATGDTSRDAITLRVDYQFEVPERQVSGGRRWKSGSVRSLMSFIPTF